MSQPVDDSHKDEPGATEPEISDGTANVNDPDATIDDTHVTADPDATLDDAGPTTESETQVEPAIASQNVDADVSMTVDQWDPSLDSDVKPEHTIKAPQSVPDSGKATVEQSVVLKRRDVSQCKDEAGQVPSADADYRVERLLGEGGMGTVFAARQQSMDRPVAIKVLKSRAARLKSSKQAFVSEAVITGGLDHPGIVPIYDVAKQADDALFYAMKQVEGVEWKERLASNSVGENLDVLLRVSDAIAFAHARAIIHRDLKPANIMLGAFGEVLVMDWGLAMLAQDHPRRDSFPRAKRGGTPHYMAPEMAGDPVPGVDRRSDVYLLGGILFEIVTGKAPHVLDAPPENSRAHVKACLAAAAQNRIASTEESGELLEIARKALATDPAERFQTVPEFQAAIREFLAHEESIEVSVRAAERLGEARRSQSYDEFSRAGFGFEAALEEWSGNERAAAGLRETRRDHASTALDRGDFDLALSLVDESDTEQAELRSSILQAIRERDARQQHIRRLRRVSFAASLGVAIVAIIAAMWINSERNHALAAQQEEEIQRGIAEQNEREANDQRKAATNAQKLAEASDAEARQNLKVAERNAYNSVMLLAQREWEDSKIGQLRDLLDRHRDRNDLKGFEWGYWDRVTQSDLYALTAESDLYSLPGVRGAAFSLDGTSLATTDSFGSYKLWDVATGKESLTLKLKGNVLGFNVVAFSPDQKWVASTTIQRKTVKVWDATTGDESLTLEGHTGFLMSLAFSPNGQRLASAANDDTVKLWDVATGQESFTLQGHTNDVGCVAFSPDSKRLASGSRDNSVKVWDVATGQESLTLNGHTRQVAAVGFSPDGQRLASASADGTVKVWDLTTGRESLGLKEDTVHARSVAFSPDGRQLAVATTDGAVKLHDAATGKVSLTLKGHEVYATSMAFSPDGLRLVSVSADQTAMMWDVTTAQDSLTLKGHTGELWSVAFSPDGKRLASASGDQTIKLWNATAGQETLTLKGHTREVLGVTFSPDGKHLASAGRDGTVKLWDVATGQESLSLTGHTEPVASVVFSPDGKRLASASWDDTVRLWDAATGQQTLTLTKYPDNATSVAFSPDGLRLVSSCADGNIRLWDAVTGELLSTLDELGGTVVFSPDGRRLAFPGEDKAVQICDAATGQKLLTLNGHTATAEIVAFSPNGQRLASASSNGIVKLWDAVTGQELLTLKGHTYDVKGLAFSPDGQRLASAGFDGTVKVWDSRSWTPEQRAQSQARGLLSVQRDRVQSLEELQTTIRSNETISEPVRTQALEWAELFWKNRLPVGP